MAVAQPQSYGFFSKKYGLLSITGLWVFGPKLLRTNSVDLKMYGISQVMGYDRYGLWQVWLYSEYFISWGDRCYRFYKVVESMSHIKNLKRLTSLMGSKEGRRSKIFSFSHFWSLSVVSLSYPQFPFLPCRDRNQVSMVVRARSPWSQDPHLSFSI